MSNAIAFTVRNGLPADILTAACPGWSELRDTADRLRAEIQRRQADQAPTIEDRIAVSDALIAARDADDIEAALDQARTNRAVRDSLDADLTNLSAARSRAETELNNLERGSVHEVTAVIRERVEDIADEINGMKHRPLSAQAAIDLDAADEWKRLRQLTGQWTALSTAYSSLVRHDVEGPAVTVLSSAAFVADPLNVHPHFQGRRINAAHPNDRPRPGSFHEAMTAWAESAPAPQFNTGEPRGGATPRDADPLAWLVYLVDHDAVTVHEPGHALALWKAATAATDDITAHSAESRAMARAEYARLIGDDELTTVEDLRPVLENARGPKRRRGSVFA
ncbi:hypothetical protein [Kocuria rosea]|uniref:hypothetical protein n=1 Tax=Kocuria rosea TaxID=1275 RepID=UPI0011A6161A|nr:hypothetical protein [Kocuria rosea]